MTYRYVSSPQNQCKAINNTINVKLIVFVGVRELNPEKLKLYFQRLARNNVKVSGFKKVTAEKHILIIENAETVVRMFDKQLDAALAKANKDVHLTQLQFDVLFSDYIAGSDDRVTLAEQYRTGRWDAELDLGVDELPISAKENHG